MRVNHPPKSSLVIPNNTQKGLDSHADADPVMAKTINIIMACRFEVIPQRFFNRFIFICNNYKYKNIISKGHSRQVFVYRYFESKSCNYK